MHCTKCGTSAQETDLYCSHCGNRLGLAGGEHLTASGREGNSKGSEVVHVDMPDELEKVVRVEQAKRADPPLVLDDWEYRFFEGQFNQYYYAITLTLRDNETKQIKLVDASVAFSDLLDQHMYGIKISPDQTIAPGQRHTVLGDYPVNRFINE